MEARVSIRILFCIIFRCWVYWEVITVPFLLSSVLMTVLSTERLFAQFNTHKHQYLDFDEFITGLAIVCRGSQEEKVHFLFDMYDVSHSKKILKSEISTLINQCKY
jgi:hypothetical protein